MRNIFVIICVLSLIVLTSSRVVQWTNAGGNPLWDFAANWDCNCVPSLTDDVVINIANIPGVVRIGNIAFAKSLTVGGSGTLSQTLTVQGQLTINGDGKLLSNGNFILDASPNAPLTVYGNFDGADRFRFNSGGLNGTGTFSFTYVNFTNPPLKAINATTTVNNLLLVDPGVGNIGTINIISKQLVVLGNITTSQSINIFSNAGGMLNVQGYFNHLGTSVTTSIIRGDATISSLISTGGTLTLNDNVTVVMANLGSGATLSLIGSDSSVRNINNIMGQGTLQVQGGVNTVGTFSGINYLNLQSGTVTSNGNQATIGNLAHSGGNLKGSTSLSVGTYTITNAQISGPSITVTSLNLQGFTNIMSAQLTVTGMAVIGKDSQFTMGNGASFVVSTNAKVSQSANFQLLPSGNTQPPSFTHNGQWTCSVGKLTVVVNTGGTGLFQFGSGSNLLINGIAFNTQTLSLTSSKLEMTSSIVSIASVQGNGVILAEGKEAYISSISASNYTHTNGFTQIGSGSIDNLYVQIGTFNVTGTQATIGNFYFEGGVVGGKNPSGVTLTISNTELIGHEPKTFENIVARSQNIDLACGSEQCQLFTQNALLTTRKAINNKL